MKKRIKWSIILGALLGVLLKATDFIKTGMFRCGIQEANKCGWQEFLKDTLLWVVITIVIVGIILFGLHYLLSYVKKSAKDMKKHVVNKVKAMKNKPKKEEKVKEEVKEVKEESEPEEDIKEETEKPKKVIKICKRPL